MVFFSALLWVGSAHAQSKSPAAQSVGARSISEKDAMARLAHRVEPIYPDDARRAQIEGTVLLQIAVGSNGSVASLKVLNGPRALAPSAALAVRQWRYRPYLISGKPIPISTTVNIDFRLTAADTMKTLEEALRAAGRSTWTQNARTYNNGTFAVERKTFWEEVTRVTVDPKTCLLKVFEDSSGTPANPLDTGGPMSMSFYLDETDAIEVLPWSGFLHLYWHVPIGGQPEYDEDVAESLYSVAYRAAGTSQRREFKYSSRESAEQVASLLRVSVNSCEARATLANARDRASLDETLHFAAEQLTGQGPVDARMKVTLKKGTVIYNKSIFTPLRYSAVDSGGASCIMQINSELASTKLFARLSLHHLTAIHVYPLKEYLEAHAWFGEGVEMQKVVEAGPSFVLQVDAPGVPPKDLRFTEEAVANRVARAMLHAADLCGSYPENAPASYTP